MNEVTVIPAPEKNDAISRIRKFMSPIESGIVLTASEEKILQRLTFANGLLAEKKFTSEEIAEKIKEVFHVSIFTSRNDVNNCYALFVNVTEDYVRYTLKHHIEDMRILVEQWKKDKSLAALLPKLFAEITRALSCLPVEKTNNDIPPPVLVFNTTKEIKAPMDAGDAINLADKIISAMKVEDVPFEDLQNESGK